MEDRMNIVTWANWSYLSNNVHMLALLDMIRLELDMYDKTPADKRGLASMIGSLHWSREFEWPWAFLISSIKEGDNILEVGGANTIFQYWCTRLTKTYTNLDIAKWELPCPNDYITMVVGDGMNLMYKDNTFDKVYCISTLEHCKDPIKCIDEMYRVVKVGGNLIVTMDVIGIATNENNVDFNIASRILSKFNMEIPDTNTNIITAKINQINHDIIAVLCFNIVKQ